MTQTPNLHLIKPAQDDFYNIDEHNENMDKIDAFAGNQKTVEEDLDELRNEFDTLKMHVDVDVDNHINNTSNPHAVSLIQVTDGVVDEIKIVNSMPSSTKATTLYFVLE